MKAKPETITAAIARTKRHIFDMNNRRGGFAVIGACYKSRVPDGDGGLPSYVAAEYQRLKVLEGLL